MGRRKKDIGKSRKLEKEGRQKNLEIPKSRKSEKSGKWEKVGNWKK